MSKELNCMNCCIGDFKHSLCDCNNGMCKEYKKVGRAEDFENEVLNRTKLKTEWIPVSERLPEVDVEVITTTDWSDVLIAWLNKDGAWETEEFILTNDEILAWMPLPEPYREDGEK